MNTKLRIGISLLVLLMGVATVGVIIKHRGNNDLHLMGLTCGLGGVIEKFSSNSFDISVDRDVITIKDENGITYKISTQNCVQVYE